jgi:GNAT superfamily N-acetyltransferase
MTASLRIRAAFSSDVPRLVALNRAAYPELVADGVIFDGAQLAAHQSVFPEGQKVCLDERGAVVGAFASLIVREDEALAAHDWIRITGHGTFATHTPSGRALYLADIYSAPEARGCGVGAALYGALFELCRLKGLSCVVAGGRLSDLHLAGPEISAAAYADEVARGARRDGVLTSQLRAGFALHGILPDYLDDWRSRSYASHLVWWNDAAKREEHAGMRPRADRPAEHGSR